MSIWGDASDALPGQPAYAVGDVVYSGTSPNAGTVVSVDAAAATLGIDWGGGPIVYPIDAPYLRKAFPWET
jgi:hypothetical protein